MKIAYSIFALSLCIVSSVATAALTEHTVQQSQLTGNASVALYERFKSDVTCQIDSYNKLNICSFSLMWPGRDPWNYTTLSCTSINGGEPDCSIFIKTNVTR